MNSLSIGGFNSHTNLYINLKFTCDVNLLSKLSIIFKEWRVIVLFVLLRSHKGQIILILCTLDTIHRLFFVTVQD
jgi:hypothetical protein